VPLLAIVVHSLLWSKRARVTLLSLLQGSADKGLIGRFKCMRIARVGRERCARPKIPELVGRLVEELASSNARIAFPDDPSRSIGISIARLRMTNV